MRKIFQCFSFLALIEAVTPQRALVFVLARGVEAESRFLASEKSVFIALKMFDKANKG